MALWNWLTGARRAEPAPRAAVQESGPGKLITTQAELAEVIRQAALSGSGAAVTPTTAMRVAAVFACVRIISGTVANLPLHVKRRISDDVRENLPDHALWKLLRTKPNRWQTPSQFRRMMQAHELLEGNAYAMKVFGSSGQVIELVPLNPGRTEVEQKDDLSLEYAYRRKDGRTLTLQQHEVFHLAGLTLDGIRGVSPITYARETIGLSLSMEDHGATLFKNGARPSSVVRHPGKLGPEGRDNLRSSLESYRAGGEREGKALILEEGMEVETVGMTAEDAQWIESRKFSRSEIAMFFGVPPHMIGDTEKSTSWGTGIEQQSIGYVTYTAEDHLTAWEQAIKRDLVLEKEPDVYAQFNRKALVRGDLKTRQGFYTAMMQWGAISPNEVRALEDMNPRPDGDVYYDPPNTAGGPEKPGGEIQ